jgi:hypothetical protein
MVKPWVRVVVAIDFHDPLGRRQDHGEINDILG